MEGIASKTESPLLTAGATPTKMERDTETVRTALHTHRRSDMFNVILVKFRQETLFLVVRLQEMFCK